MHGANRLASNSLLEASVFGRRAGAAAAQALDPATPCKAVQPVPDLPHAALQDLRQAMSRDAGVMRDGAGLTRLRDQIDKLHAEHGPAAPLVAAGLIAAAALDRRESRGGHYRADFPQPAASAERTFTTLSEAEAHRSRHAAA